MLALDRQTSSDETNGYNIETIDYRDIFGNLMFSEPMIFKRLHAVGEIMIHHGIDYIVKRVAVADTVQHVNLATEPNPSQ